MPTVRNDAGNGARILAVDDVEAKRYAWERILTRAGFQVFTASTGTEALIRVKENPDLVILDVRLPDIDGLDVCRRIKGESSTASIPVLHISASLISPEDRTAALEGGADGYLTEPVNAEELVASVKALLRMRRAEEEARKAAREWQTTFDTIQDGIVVLDDQGTIARCNQAFLDISGRTTPELLRSKLRTVLSTLNLEGLKLPDGATPSLERRTAELRWSERWIRVTIDPISNHGGRGGCICIFSDVTGRKLAEQEAREGKERLHHMNASLEERVTERTERLQTAVRELEAFTYTIAHDLRAPLRAIHRFSEILLEEFGPKMEAHGQDYARRIISGAEKMDTLIANLLEYSRLAQSEIHPQSLAPSEVVAEVVQHLLADSSLRVPELLVDPDLPRVIGDPLLLRQIFFNLLSNAVKFVPPGDTPKVRVRSERLGDRVVLSVVDNGIGIPEDSQSRLFRVFERLGDAKDYPGTGIGLAIVRRAVERMGGDYGVESASGRGSRFWIRLPAAGPKEKGRP
jgi:PAS domain S-box-containing protein